MAEAHGKRYLRGRQRVAHGVGLDYRNRRGNGQVRIDFDADYFDSESPPYLL
jgi:hypothetical protein